MDLFNKPIIAFLLLTISAGVAADSAPFNGTVRTEAPAVTVAKTDKPIAFVKEFSIKAEPNTDVCEISADEKYAQKGVNAAGKFICFFEWQPNEYGSVINKLEQSGVLKKTGHLNFAYKLYMFNRGEKHEVSQNSFAVFVEVRISVCPASCFGIVRPSDLFFVTLHFLTYFRRFSQTFFPLRFSC